MKMELTCVKVMDLILLSLICCSRQKRTFICFSIIPSGGDGPAEKQHLMIVSFSKIPSSGFPGRRDKSWCELMDLLMFVQIPVRHKFMGSQTTLAPPFVELLALFCGGFLKSNLSAFAKLLLCC